MGKAGLDPAFSLPEALPPVARREAKIPSGARQAAPVFHRAGRSEH